MNAYQKFVQINYYKAKNITGEYSLPQDVFKKLAEMWRSCSDEEKELYYLLC